MKLKFNIHKVRLALLIWIVALVAVLGAQALNHMTSAETNSNETSGEAEVTSEVKLGPNGIEP